VAAHTSEALREALAPLTADPARAAVFCDIDGVLAPIVGRAEDAQVRHETALLLSRLARRYAQVGCVSGRSANEARRLVGVGGIAYAGSHGAELLEPGAASPRINPAFKSWESRVKKFVADRDNPDLRRLRVRIEDKGPIVALHWRGNPDEDASEIAVKGVAERAEAAGLATHWGRKVLEIRPPIALDKGRGIHWLLRDADLDAALYVGDDRTDVDAFRGLRELVEGGRLAHAVCVGVRSEETPGELESSADVLVDGTRGVRSLLEALLD
jgi:trehalose 6-phosphate phosphatase